MAPDRCRQILQPPPEQPADGVEDGGAAKDDSFRLTWAEPQAGQGGASSPALFCSFSNRVPHARQRYSNIGMDFPLS